MDFKRTALIAGLAITSYFMLLAWNEDYPNVPAQNQDIITTGTINSVTDNIDLPTTLATGNSTVEIQNADIPQINSSVANVTVETNTENLIIVKTPIHELAIDPVGGDIVSLQLPKYPVSIELPDTPFELLRNNASGVFVAQSGLIGRNGPDANETGRPVYQSVQQTYILNEGDNELSIDLTFTDENNVTITKRFTFNEADYLIQVQYSINNQGSESWGTNLFGQIKRDASIDPSSTSGMGMKTYLGAALTIPDDPYKKVDFDDMDDGTTDDVVGGWIAFSQHYFLSAWIPDSNITNRFTTRKNSRGEYILGFTSPEVIVQPGSTETINSDFWAGPKDQYRLEEISPNMGKTIDYSWLWFIASPIFWLLTQINNLIGNFGFSIIALTIVIKILFSKLSASSYRSMAKMRLLAPKIQQLKDRYGDDKQKIMQEQMALWKKEKVNPLGGCLPMLLQMPVLIGIYWVLNESVELRQAPFILWYKDLSIMDPFFILPLIMGASMFISQTMTPMTTADPMQAKVMKFMPVIFTIFFLWFPAGLVLYWLVSNIFNICQQTWINKQVNETYNKKAN